MFLVAICLKLASRECAAAVWRVLLDLSGWSRLSPILIGCCNSSEGATVRDKRCPCKLKNRENAWSNGSETERGLLFFFFVCYLIAVFCVSVFPNTLNVH